MNNAVIKKKRENICWTYVEKKLDAMRVLRHAGERFRSATSGVVRAPVQYSAVWDVGG